MNTEQFLEELKVAHGSLNKISNAIASPEGIVNNAEYGYLKDKMHVLCNTADHVLGQIKNKMKEQSMERRKVKQRGLYHQNKKQ